MQRTNQQLFCGEPPAFFIKGARPKYSHHCSFERLRASPELPRPAGLRSRRAGVLLTNSCSPVPGLRPDKALKLYGKLGVDSLAELQLRRLRPRASGPGKLEKRLPLPEPIILRPVSPRSLNGATAMASEKNLQELFHETLKDIYFAEKKILSALPKMAKAAQSQELKAAFEKHENETEEHVARLEKVFEEIDETPRGKTCDAIMGIIEEGQEVMKEFKGAPALDAGLLAAAQAVEHYEIARYGTLKTWAAELGLNQAVKLLDMTLGEEKKTDETLTKLAQSEVNQHAQAA
jgi:ferritin-like metal-binding protein YciE